MVFYGIDIVEEYKPVLLSILQLGFVHVSSWLDLGYVIFAKKYYISGIVPFSAHQMKLRYKIRKLGGSNKGDFDTFLAPKDLEIS